MRRICNAVPAAEVEQLLGTRLGMVAPTAGVTQDGSGGGALEASVGCEYSATGPSGEESQPTVTIHLDAMVGMAKPHYERDAVQAEDSHGAQSVSVPITAGRAVAYADGPADGGLGSATELLLFGDSYWQINLEAKMSAEDARAVVGSLGELIAGVDVHVTSEELLADPQGPCAGLPSDLVAATAQGDGAVAMLYSAWSPEYLGTVTCRGQGDAWDVRVVRVVNPNGLLGDAHDMGTGEQIGEEVPGVDGGTAQVGAAPGQGSAIFTIDGQSWWITLTNYSVTDAPYDQILDFTRELVGRLT